MDDAQFLIASEEFFEHPAAIPTGTVFMEVLTRTLPPGWSLRSSGIWTHAEPPSGPALPNEGFKLHVSTVPPEAAQVLAEVAGVCAKWDVPFKVAKSLRILLHLNSKGCGRGTSGKFITIYPTDRGHFEEIAASLRSALGPSVGPYILSDRRVPGTNNVFYRYGAFRSRRAIESDGSHRELVATPDGMLIGDERAAYFSLPPGVTDPWEASQEQHVGRVVLCNGRYEILGALAFCNSGGVYHGLDRQTGRPIVVKEARPHTKWWSAEGYSGDAVFAIHAEYDILQRLSGLPCVPAAVALFEQWEHTFLVEDRVDARPLTDLVKSDEYRFTELLQDPNALRRYYSALRAIASQLLEAIGSVHARRIVLGDVSPNNILVSDGHYAVTLVDFESAVRVDDTGPQRAYASHIYTPGFRLRAGAETRSINFDRDYVAAGMTLFWMLLPIQPMFDLRADASREFLEHLLEVGLAPEFHRVLECLIGGDARGAQSALAKWRLS